MVVRNRIVAGVAVVAVSALAIYALNAGSGEPGLGPRRNDPLLARAISALGGADALRQVRAIVIRSKLNDHGRVMDVTTHLELPDRYRHDVDTGDAHLVHATDGQSAWASLDEVPVPLDKDEFRRLKEQMSLVQISLLVGLEDRQRASVKEKGIRDGLDWLEVTFRGDDGGTFLLGFDATTNLLTRAEWETRVTGQRRPLPISVTLGDYRREGGIMVPFDATFTAEKEVVASDRIESVGVNPVIAPELFAAPVAPEDPPIRRRTRPDAINAILPAGHNDARVAERLILAWIKDHEIPRNGPVFHVMTDGKPVGVGIPVRPPPATPAGAVAAEVDAPKLRVDPSTDVLTTIVVPSTPEALARAEKTLNERARTLELEAAGPLRHVLWNDEITQVQLPFRARKR